MELGTGAAAPDVPGIDDLVPIATGGMSVVYRGHQRNLQRVVAVKVVHAFGAPGDALARWRREVAAVARLSSHPGIVAVYDGGITARGEPFIVMPLLEGGSLTERVRRSGPLDPDAVRELGSKLASALAATHAAGVLHRDVKPDNVLLTADGEPQLTDFGIARLVDTTHTTAAVVHATIPYAAPEVLSGQPATEATDVYSLAATLVFCLTGASPFAAHRPDEPVVALVTRVATQPPPDLAAAGVPGPLAQLLTQALAKDPSQRPRSAEELRRRLEAAAAGAGAHDTVPFATPTQPMAPAPVAASSRVRPASAGSRAAALALAALVLVALAAGAAFLVLRDGNGGPGSGEAGTTAPAARTRGEATTTSTTAPATTDAPATTASPTTVPRTTAPPPTEAPPPTGTAVATAVAYAEALGRGEFDAAYAMLTPAFRAIQSEEDFVAFWGGFDQVARAGEPVERGGGRVALPLRLDGSEETFPLTLVRDADRWLIDGPRPKTGKGRGGGGDG